MSLYGDGKKVNKLMNHDTLKESVLLISPVQRNM